MDGKFTIPSAQRHRSYRERTFEYEILQVNRQDGTVIGEGEKERISREDLQDADQVFYKLTDYEGDQMYKWVAGPFPDQETLESDIEDLEVYGSPMSPE